MQICYNIKVHVPGGLTVGSGGPIDGGGSVIGGGRVGWGVLPDKTYIFMSFT